MKMVEVVNIETFGSEMNLKPYPHGLLSPATTISESPPVGFSDRLVYSTSERVAVNIFTENSIEGTSPLKASVVVEEGDFSRSYTPFQIEVKVSGSTLGAKPEEIDELAKKYMEVVTQKAIEREFWDGSIATSAGFTNNRYLTSSDATTLSILTDNGVHPKVALGVLEQALANCGLGEIGVIHVPVGVSPFLNLNEVDDGYYTTKAGNHIVIGSGYEIDPGSLVAVPMVATGPVSVYLGPVTSTWQNIIEGTNTRTNKMEFIYTREAAVVWTNGCHFTINADITA